VLISHLGRPDGTGYEASSTLKPIADHLSSLLGTEVGFPSTDCVDDASSRAVSALKNGEILLLENTRFHSDEKSGGVEFAERLAAYGDIYCNDAFGASHRLDASIAVVPKVMSPRPCVAGRLLMKEIRWLRDAIDTAEQPFVAVLGGAKVSDKLGAIRALSGRVDTLIVGGAMAFTLLKALGHSVGSSLVEDSMIDEAAKIIVDVEKTSTTLMLPSDFVCGEEMSSETETSVQGRDIPNGLMGLDIGPKTTAAFTAAVRHARTVVWNGPMGLFEVSPFDVGTRQIAEACSQATAEGASTIAGGGDTAAALASFGMETAVSHVSTGGGASIKMLEGVKMPALDVLDRN
jgi:phosphoglycerate kinase